jgi:hypothetical protein
MANSNIDCGAQVNAKTGAFCLTEIHESQARVHPGADHTNLTSPSPLKDT